MSISPVTREQLNKVVKATLYSFASGFVGAVTLMSGDFIRAAQEGKAGVVNLTVALLAAAVISGLNATMVYVKQLFTPNE